MHRHAVDRESAWDWRRPAHGAHACFSVLAPPGFCRLWFGGSVVRWLSVGSPSRSLVLAHPLPRSCQHRLSARFFPQSAWVGGVKWSQACPAPLSPSSPSTGAGHRRGPRKQGMGTLAFPHGIASWRSSFIIPAKHAAAKQDIPVRAVPGLFFPVCVFSVLPVSPRP